MARLHIRKHLSELGVSGGAWVLIVLFSASHIQIPEEARNRVQALEISAIQWLVWAIAFLLIVYLDQLLARRQDRLLLRLLPQIPCSLLIAVFTSYVSAVLEPLATTGSLAWPPLFKLLRESWSTKYFTHVVIYWAIVGVYFAYDYRQRLSERELKAAHLERSVAQLQLDILKAQLQPHFLFNALNTISAHVEQDPRLVRRMIEQLGELLRLSLEFSATNEIPLFKELAFLKNYVALQECRYSDQLHVLWNIDLETENALVPTLILQPLVENAIVHGISHNGTDTTIKISIRKEQELLHISIEDNGFGLPPAWNLENSAGVGIANTRERLQWLYADSTHSFHVSDGAGNRGVRVDIVIPFQTEHFLTPAQV
jgi:signal transduction histidine kinase